MSTAVIDKKNQRVLDPCCGTRMFWADKGNPDVVFGDIRCEKITLKDKRMNRIYLAGPMTNLPDFNYPAFHVEAARLRAMGYHVENPAENPEPPCKTWLGYMRMALTQLVLCDTVATLPNIGGSRGGRIEVQLALDLGLKIAPSSRITVPKQHG